MVSIVAAGVIVLLPAADKPLEESGLCWILSGRRQTGRVGSTGQPGGFFWGGSSSFSSFFFFCLSEETTEAADRDRYQHLSVIIRTRSSPDALICSSSRCREFTDSEFRRSQRREKPTDCGGDAPLVELHSTSASASLQLRQTLC